jgi:L-cystine transport system substrate-binding protein
MKTIGKSTNLFLLIALTVIVLSSCGSNQAEQTEQSDRAEPEVQEVIIGTGADFPPLSFYNDKNELTGFEKDMLDAIDERLPQYTFTYQTFDFTNILMSLESNKVDVGVHLFEYNIERDQKYLYGKEGYYKFDLNWIVREDDDSIGKIEDLAGKTYVSEGSTSNNFYLVNKWNEEHGKPFEIIISPNYPLVVEDLESGAADATLATISQLEGWQREYNAKLKANGQFQESPTYLLFNKDTGAQLQEDFDNALAEIKADGTLAELAVKYGIDTERLEK